MSPLTDKSIVIKLTLLEARLLQIKYLSLDSVVIEDTLKQHSRPTYKMVICRIETYDCRKSWRLVKTSKGLAKSNKSPYNCFCFLGYCLEFYVKTQSEINEARGEDPVPRVKDETRKLRQLGFTIAYNKSDSTYG